MNKLRLHQVIVLLAVMLGFVKDLAADMPPRLTNAEVVERSFIVVEAEVLSIRKEAWVRILRPESDGGAVIEKIDDAALAKFRSDDPIKAERSVFWRHEMELKVISMLSSEAMDSHEIKKIVAYLNTYGSLRADAYKGPLPNAGDILTFFGIGEVPVIDTEGTLKLKIGLFNDLRSPGIVSTLVRTPEGKLSVTERTPIDTRHAASDPAENKPSKGTAVTPNLTVTQLPGSVKPEAKPKTAPSEEHPLPALWSSIVLVIILLLGLIWMIRRK